MCRYLWTPSGKGGLQGDPLETGAVALSWSPGTEMYPTGPCTQMGRYW